jgi:hypothetical protein
VVLAMSGVVTLSTEARAQVAQLLTQLAGDPRPCRACKRLIWFVPTRLGSKMPVDDDAVSHFKTCPAAEEFRRKNPLTRAPTLPGLR